MRKCHSSLSLRAIHHWGQTPHRRNIRLRRCWQREPGSVCLLLLWAYLFGIRENKTLFSLIKEVFIHTEGLVPFGRGASASGVGRRDSNKQLHVPTLILPTCQERGFRGKRRRGLIRKARWRKPLNNNNNMQPLFTAPSSLQKPQPIWSGSQKHSDPQGTCGNEKTSGFIQTRMIYNACRGYGPPLQQSLQLFRPCSLQTCSFHKQRPDQVCPQSTHTMIQVQITQALGEEGRARGKTPPPTPAPSGGAQRLAAFPRGSDSVYEVPLPNLWEQTQLPSRSANKCLQLKALGMAEVALNSTDSLSLPLYFIYIF